MINLKKKIVAIVTVMSVASFVMPGTGLALTADELQAQINSLLATLSSLQAQLSQLQSGGTGTVTGCTIASFDRNLTLGSSGNDVKCLQVVLNSAADTQVAASGTGSAGYETTYFGPLTKAAVVKFQEKYASTVLTPSGLTAGTGFVGTATRAKLNGMLGVTVPTTPTTPTVPATGATTISLASDTPETSQIALQAQDVIFTKIAISGGATGATITKIIVTRGGVSADADLSAIKLYDGTTQVASSQALNTNSHAASFSGFSWAIPAGTTKYLTIKGTIAGSGTATVGDGVKLGIASAADITSTIALTGTFPIYGNTKTIAGVSVGYPDITKQATPATTTLISGAVEQEIASWKITATTTEGLSLHSLKLTQVGSATANDIANIKLKVDGLQIGSTIAKIDNQNSATFDLSAAPLVINASASKTIYAYADIGSGIFTSRTVIFEITQYTDVVAYGGNSGGSVIFRSFSNQVFTKQTGNTMTVGQGALTIALDASLNPSDQTYVKGTSNRLMNALKFSTGSTEGVRITKLVLTLTGTGSATDLANVTLWDGSTQIAGPASVIGSQITFGSNTIGWDTTGLFDIAKSSSKYIQVKADIPSGATTGHTLLVSFAAATDVYADGLQSQYDVPSGSITRSSGTGNTLTVGASGALTIAKSASSPTAQTYVKGSTEKEFLRINLTAGSGEDVSVTALTIDCDAPTSDCASGDLANIKIIKSDGSQFGNTYSTPVATASFSGNLVIPASGTVTLKVVADIPSGTALDTNGVVLSLTYGDNLTATGISSAASISEDGTATGSTMPVDAGSLTLSAAATPGDQTVIIGSADVSFVSLLMTAGTAEDVRVTYVKLTVNSTGAAAPGDVGNIALWDGSTRITAKKNLTTSTDGVVHHTVFYTAADFLNGTGLDITKGAQKTITVKADLLSTGINGDIVALGVSSTDDFIVTGLSSNSTIAEGRTALCSSCTGINFDYAGAAAANQVTLSTAGTLVMTNDAGKPVTAIQAVGSEGVGATAVPFHQIDLIASLEDIYVKSVTVERATGYGSDADFGAITIWDGSTQLGTAQYLVNATTTFNFPEGSYWRLTKGVTKVLTVKADLAGIIGSNYGATSGDNPLLRVDDITVQGVSSGNTSITTTADLAGNQQYVRQSKPTIAAASLPTTVLSSGEKVFYRWTVTADSKGAISWGKITFNFSGTLASDGIGTATSTSLTLSDTYDDAIYTVNSGTSVGLSKGINQFKVWNITDSVQVTGTTTDAAGYNLDTNTVGAIIRWDMDSGNGVFVTFVPATEEIVAAGQTKTYELRGTVLLTPATSDAILVKIPDLSTTATTGDFQDIRRNASSFANEHISLIHASTAVNGVSFIWSDKSDSDHTSTCVTDSCTDWTNDYKVTGLPATTLSLTR